MIHVHHEFFFGGRTFDQTFELHALAGKVCGRERQERRLRTAVAQGFAPLCPEGAFIDPILGEAERKPAEFAKEQIAERFVAVHVDDQAFVALGLSEVRALTPRRAHGVEEPLHFRHSAALPGPGNGQEGGVPGDLRARRDVVVAHDAA